MEIVTAIGSKLGEYLVEATVHQACYLFCFNGIVADLKKEEGELKCEHDGIKEKVEREQNNTKEIDEVVKKWLKDVDDVMNDVAKLKDEIQAKQSCLNGWCPNWGCRYWLGRKASKKTVIMSKLIDKGGKFNINTVAHLKPRPGIEFSSPRDFVSFEATELACVQIIKALKDEKMVGLYGSGGAGKTTLAKVVGKELQQQKIFDEVVIAVVSQNPDFKKLQIQLAEQLRLKFEEESIEERSKRLYLRFTGNESKILVILDDVWKEHNLKNELGIPVDDNHNGCKILLTTRRRQVCDLMRCNCRILLGILKPEEGLALLKKYAGIDDDDSTLIDVSKEVAGECKGLPLAIAAVGSALKGKKGIDEWNMVSRQLKNSKLNDLDDIEGERDVYACIKLSYDYLKNDEAKLCFLFCSLYPEDHEIELEVLVRYGLGLGRYQDVKTIEEARSILRGTIKGLKDSSLLLYADNEGFVKMHDIVRDVAIWIGSKEMSFMSRARIGLTKWPEDEALEQYRAISLLGNNIEKLPSELVCRNLEILLLGGLNGSKLVVPDQFFEGMKRLKIATIMYAVLSLKSLRYLTKLQVLHLIYCDVSDVAFLGELKGLQILSLEDSSCDEIPEELWYELRELRLLDICRGSISPITISRFSRLEEFYGLIKKWVVQEISSEKSHENAECLSKDFTFRKLQRYSISNRGFQKLQRYSISNRGFGARMETNSLSIENIAATSLVIFSALYENLQCLYLENVTGCQNIVPSIDQKGLTKLTDLELEDCNDLECLLDASQNVSSQNLAMLSSLELNNLPKLRWIWKAPAQHVNLKNLTNLEVKECHNLTYLFSLSLARSLVQLKSLQAVDCERLKCIIEGKFDGNEREIHIHGEDENTILLPMLKELTLKFLPNLISFCSENYCSTLPTLQEKCPLLTVGDEFTASALSLVGLVNLKNLTNLEVKECRNLTYLFSLSQARSLVQLKSLRAVGCERLKCVIEGKFDGDERGKHIHEEGENTIVLPMLREITLENLPNLISFCSENYYSTWPTLQELTLEKCPLLTVGDEFTASALSLVVGELRVLHVKDCYNFCDVILALLKHGLKSLEKLTIGKVQVVVQQLEDIIFNAQESKLFPCLKELSLGDLGELEVLYRDPAHVPHLQNLTTLEVYECNRLRYVFSLTLARNLLQLERLYIRNCSELVQIIDEDSNGNSEQIIYDHHQPLRFPKLTGLSVYRCPKLKRLFHISVAPSLQKLFWMSITNNDELEEVFWQKGGADVMDNKEIVMTRLSSLGLTNLPKLTNFFPVGYQFAHRSLDSEIAENCKNFGAEKLKTLCVERCYNLCDAIPTLLKYGSKNLENLTIFKVGVLLIQQLEDIISHTQESKLFPNMNLKKLKLSGLREVEVLYRDPAHVFSLQNLTNLEVYKCDRLRYVFSLTLARNMLQLEDLSIEDCSELEQIIDEDGNGEQIIYDHHQPLRFPKLTYLSVDRCPKLKRLFHISIAPSLQKLSQMYIGDNDDLEEVFWQKDGADVMDNKEIVMTRLSSLGLTNLPKLTNFFPVGYQFAHRSLDNEIVENCKNFGAEKLKMLHVEGCYKLCDIIPALLKYGSKNLKDLTIAKVGVPLIQQLEDIISHVQESKLFPNLKKLELSGLREAEVLYRDPVHLFCLQNLTTLYLKCNRLRYVFSLTLARNLLQLEDLHIEDCSELEQIIDEDDNGEQIIYDHHQHVCFPRLKYLNVQRCSKLKRLFHISVAPSLQELVKMTIEDNDELKEIFWHKDGADVMDDKEIVMTQLLELSLKRLPKLTNFFPLGYQFTHPCLRSERIESCPKYSEVKYNISLEEVISAPQTTSKEDAGEEGFK